MSDYINNADILKKINVRVGDIYGLMVERCLHVLTFTGYDPHLPLSSPQNNKINVEIN